MFPNTAPLLVFQTTRQVAPELPLIVWPFVALGLFLYVPCWLAYRAGRLAWLVCARKTAQPIPPLSVPKGVTLRQERTPSGDSSAERLEQSIAQATRPPKPEPPGIVILREDQDPRTHARRG